MVDSKKHEHPKVMLWDVLHFKTPQVQNGIVTADFGLKTRNRIGGGVSLQKFDHFRVVAHGFGEDNFAAVGKMRQTGCNVCRRAEIVQPIDVPLPCFLDTFNINLLYMRFITSTLHTADSKC